ncbi:ER membrane protein complex subunit 4 [Dromaius novaehollandiae]|uniref:ER membrane protein complex subunit 4 n=1 Tax=Dromaius novaehollandiae TaxID=8790 RepID=UPI00311DBBCC
MAAVAARGRRFKWALELAAAPGGRPRGGAEPRGPVGYAEKQVPDGGVQETDRILVEKRCWDVALGPLKQIPMNLFIMYMAGNTISIFPAMMVCMMGWRPLQALLSLGATLKVLESSSQTALQGLVFLVGNGLGLALALYKCQAMGLLPTHASDWLAFIAPPQRMEFSGGGLVL